MNIPKESTVSGGTSKSITIRAKGTICQGGWPQMHLYINGQFVTGWTVNSSSYANYTATVTLSGQDEFDVFFANDCYAPPEDRNLFIDYVIVDGRTIQAEGGEMFRIPGYQASQLNWSGAVPGTETLASLGALRFVVGAGAFAGGYDANGNLIYRLVDGAAHTLTYDAENRLVEVKRGSTVVASYVYDHSGFRVRQTIGGTTTAFVGTYYEIGSEVTKYYFAAGQRVALRSNSQGVKYLLGDHLGSTSITATTGGTSTRQLYTAWGEVRFRTGELPTEYTYTGQYAWASLGIVYYNARNYDPSLGRFLSADTVVPNAGVPGNYDRFAYVKNAPTRYIDPTGHDEDCMIGEGCADDAKPILQPQPPQGNTQRTSTRGRFLSGGPGSQSYNEKTEDGYDGFEGSGAGDPYTNGLYRATNGLGFINDLLVFIRDNTQLFRFSDKNGEVVGIVEFQYEPVGWRITRVGINNDSFEPIRITSVAIDIQQTGGAYQGNWKKLYPYNGLFWSPTEYGSTFPQRNRPISMVSVNSGLIYSSQTVTISIFVRSPSGRWTNLTHTMRVDMNVSSRPSLLPVKVPMP